MVKKKQELIYLASPYTHTSKVVMHQRFEKVLRLTANLIKKGKFVFSPIAYGHVMAGRYDMPTSWDYWYSFDETVISRCDKLMVFKINGWQKSKGVKSEIDIAKKCKIPIEYVEDKIKKKISNKKCVCLMGEEHDEV